MSYSSTPQQPSPVMSMVKPDQVSHSPTGAHSHQRGPLQGDLRDMISMYIPGGDTTDSGAQRGYSNIQQHYLTGTAPLTHIWSGNSLRSCFRSGGPPVSVVDAWTLTWYVKKDEGVWTHGRTGYPKAAGLLALLKCLRILCGMCVAPFYYVFLRSMSVFCIAFDDYVIEAWCTVVGIAYSSNTAHLFCFGVFFCNRLAVFNQPADWMITAYYLHSKTASLICHWLLTSKAWL